MCIALPVRIVAISDPKAQRVVVESRRGTEDVDAALVMVPGQAVSALLGCWALVHAGFVLSLIDDEDAQSRLAMFAAMGGDVVDDAALRPCDDD